MTPIIQAALIAAVVHVIAGVVSYLILRKP